MYSLKHVIRLCNIAKSGNYSLPKGFKNKSYAWLCRNYNGIGAEWMPKCVRQKVTKLFSYMEPVALVHDYEYLSEDKSYWNFTKANMRLAYNGAKSGYLFSGLALAVICQCFGWSAWKEGKETMSWHYYLNESGDKHE
jgi:hypothetical protein